MVSNTENRFGHHEHTGSADAIVLSSDRAFGVVFGVFWALVGLLPLLSSRPVRWWALVISLICVVSALAIPRALHPLNLIWAKLAELLHRIVSPLAMALVYFLAFTTMGLLLKAMGKDLLRLRQRPDNDTYWIRREPPGPAPDTMSNQF